MREAPPGRQRDLAGPDPARAHAEHRENALTITLLRGNAADLPLDSSSVDLIVGSPPYWQLRDYRDKGASLAGQLGNEPTWQEYIANLVACTAEWMRVLKPTGSIFMVIGDKFGRGTRTTVHGGNSKQAYVDSQRPGVVAPTGSEKSLLSLPQRYAIACTDRLGLTKRAEIIWAKVNGLPESAKDRVHIAHEYVIHLTLLPQYYQAVDEIRELHAETSIKRAQPHRADPGRRPASIYQNQPGQTLSLAQMNHPLGKLPGSVWFITSQPLIVPAHLGTDHYAAYPMELPRRIIRGWCPPAICCQCGEGRRPVTRIDHERGWTRRTDAHHGGNRHAGEQAGQVVRNRQLATILGYACACTPYTDHPGPGTCPDCGQQRTPRTAADTYTRQRDERGWHGDGVVSKRTLGPSAADRNRQIVGYACACTPYTDHPPTKRGVTLAAPGSLGIDPREQWTGRLDEREQVGPWREYHLDSWAAPPSRAAVVLDPFGGTGTTAMVADALGRHGISVELSSDYLRIAQWRTTDPGERAKAFEVAKPPPVPPGQEALFDL